MSKRLDSFLSLFLHIIKSLYLCVIYIKCRWDTFADNLELVDTYEGHYDVVYGTIHPKYLSRCSSLSCPPFSRFAYMLEFDKITTLYDICSRWQSKRDFVISRQWFHAQDGTYSKTFLTLISLSAFELFLCVLL